MDGETKYMVEVNGNGSSNGKGAADALLEHIAQMPAVIVGVKCPSGFTYKMSKPSKFGLIFDMGALPGDLASEAVQQWEADGVIERNEDGELDQSLKVLDAVFSLLERVCHYSQEPKILLNGKPSNSNEIMAPQVPPDDLDFLCQWVKSGGEMSAMLAMFPKGSSAGAMARSNKRKVRHASK